MGLLDFIFGCLVLVFIFVCFVAYLGIKYDVNKINEENEKLRIDLHNARKKKTEAKKDVK